MSPSFSTIYFFLTAVVIVVSSNCVIFPIVVSRAPLLVVAYYVLISILINIMCDGIVVAIVTECVFGVIM